MTRETRKDVNRFLEHIGLHPWLYIDAAQTWLVCAGSLTCYMDPEGQYFALEELGRLKSCSRWFTQVRGAA